MKKLILINICLLSLFCGKADDGWNQKSNLPATGRHRGTGLAIGQRGYIGLGHMNGTGNNIVYSDWWEFDPATNSWTQKADFPVGTYGASAFSIGNYGYVGGGTGLSNEFYKFDPALNEWLAIADALFANPSDQTAFSINGRGYILDGTTLLEYKPSTDSWATKASCPITGWAITSFVIGNSAYVKAGNQLYEYKPSVDQWTQRATFPGVITNGSSAFSVENKGYIISGYSSFLNPVFSEMWEYNPATNEWIQMEDFPGTSRRFSVAFSINNKGYFGGGTNGTNMNDFWEYNPKLKGLNVETNQILLKKPYPNPAIDEINFELNTNLTSNQTVLKIYNTNGQLIESINFIDGNYIFKRNNLNSGVYLYQLTNSHKIISNGTFIFK